MKILLVNVDSRWNMALRKMYAYFKQEHHVDMIDLGFIGYPHKRRKTIDAAGYDRVFVSNLFDVNANRVDVVNCEDVTFGGIGSRNPRLQLPPDIEQTKPWYDEGGTESYGFVTRGCINNCWFCKVPKYEGKLKEYNSVESIVRGVPGERVHFLDNNILAYPHHMEVFRWLIERVEWCRARECLPYVMRDAACWQCDDKAFLTDYAAYCNQAGMFKNLTFAQFMEKRTKNAKRREKSIRTYNEEVGKC